MGSKSYHSFALSLFLRQLQIIVISVLLILLGPPYLVSTLVLGVHYCAAVLYSRLFRPELRILHGSDAMWAAEHVYQHAGTNNILHLICKGAISVDELRVLFQKNVLGYRDPVSHKVLYNRLHKRWTTFFGYYFWTLEDPFDLNQHVRLYDYDCVQELALPSPCTQADLVGVTGKLLGRPFKKGTSPWELLLIPNYKTNEEAEEGLVLCLRFHHSLGDGYSILGLIHRMFDSPMPPPMGKFPPKLSLLQRTLRNLTVVLLLPFELAMILVDTLASKSGMWVPRKALGACFTFCSEQIEWQEVRTVMRKYKVNSNAAIYSVTAGAAFRLMQEAGQAVPNGLICGFTPFPLPNHPGGLVNHMSCAYFKMKFKDHSEGKLVKKVGNQIQPAHALNRFAVLTNWGVRMLGCVYPAWVWQIIRVVTRLKVGPRFAFGATSVPGPATELEIGGVRLVDIITSLGHPKGGPTAAVATMMSIAGKVRIVITVDRGAFEGFCVPKDFAKHVKDELNAVLLSNEDDVV